MTWLYGAVFGRFDTVFGGLVMVRLRVFLVVVVFAALLSPGSVGAQEAEPPVDSVPVPTFEPLDDPAYDLAELVAGVEGPTVVEVPGRPVPDPALWERDAAGVPVPFEVDGQWRSRVVAAGLSTREARAGWVPVVGSARGDVDGLVSVTGAPVTVRPVDEAAVAGFEARVSVLDGETARELSPFGAAVALDWRGGDGSSGPVEVELDLSDVDLGGAMAIERLGIIARRGCVSRTVEFETTPQRVTSVPFGPVPELGPVEVVVESSTRVECDESFVVPVVDVDIAARVATVRVDVDELVSAATRDRVAAARAGLGQAALDSSQVGVAVSEVRGQVVEGLPVGGLGEWPAESGVLGVPSAGGGALAPVSPSGGGGIILALSSGSSGASGDLGAVPIPTLGSADVGPYSGAAQYVYDVDVPAAAAGPAPSVSLVYSSASIDGLNSQSNTQAGGVGVGWSLAAGGSITREWGSCGVLNSSSVLPGELCNAGDRYSLNLNGRSSRLLPKGSGGEYRLEDDPNWKIKQWFTASGTGEYLNEWWIVTTPDGTEYEFGRDPSRNSVALTWIADASACPGAFLDTCQRAWSWQLDEVKDTNGNQAQYFYSPEYNNYQLWGSAVPSDPSSGIRASYTRALQLDSIYYTRGTAQTEANARVMFRWETRCGDASTTYGLCDPYNSPSDYPDTPLDLWCRDLVAQAACDQSSPSFWSASRLGSIQTQVYVGGYDWKTTATHDLAQSFPDPGLDPDGDPSDAKLVLYRIHRRPTNPITYLGIDQIEAEDYIFSNGGVTPYTGTGTNTLDSSSYVGNVDVGDWFKIEDVDLGAGSYAANKVRVNYSSPYASTVEIRRGSSTGPLLATVTLPATGGWTTQWNTVTVATNSTNTTGIDDVVVVGKSATTGTAIANINWIRFASNDNPTDFLDWPSLPPVDFFPDSQFAWLDNRVNAPAGVSPMRVARIKDVLTELGGKITFTYRSNVKATDCPITSGYDQNHYFCYPAYDAITGSGGWVQWWRWPVVQMDADDGFNPTVTTAYSYDYPSYAFYDSLAPDDTWSEFRGYRTVTIDVGDTSGTHSTTEMRFFQGMWDDLTYPSSNNIPKYDTVPRSDGANLQDREYWRGRPYEIRTLDAGHQPITSTYYWYTDTVTTTAAGDKAYFVAPEIVREITHLPGTDLEIKTDTTYDSYGNVATITEYGEINTAGDERYTSFQYAVNVPIWITSTPCQIRVWDNDDGSNGGNADMVTRTRFYYDNSTADCATPSDGDLTSTKEYRTATGSTVTTTYTSDSQGRITRVTDPNGNDTTTAYHPLYGYPQTVTNDAGHAITSVYDSYQRLFSTSGPNTGQLTETFYDAYGRVYLVDSPLQQTNPNAYDFNVYDLSQQAGLPSSITQWRWVDAIGGSGSFNKIVTYVDGFGRPLQTQTPGTAGGKRWVDFSRRNNRGLPERTTVAYEYSGEPGDSYMTPNWNTAVSQTRTLYDDSGRVTKQQLRTPNAGQTGTDLHSQTEYTYNGYTVTTKDPITNQSRSTYDAYGNLTLVETGPSGSLFSEDTNYEYDAANRLVQVTDDLNNVTSISYDLTGEKTSLNDPDTGTWAYTYDAAGNLQTQQDGSGTVIWNGYDNLNRLTQQRETNSAGAFLARYDYDTAFKGALDWAQSYEAAGTITHNYTAYNVAGQPTAENWVIPGPAGGTYATTTTYTESGTTYQMRYPANNTGGLGETVALDYYNRNGLPRSLTSATNGTTYVRDTTYLPSGNIAQIELGPSGSGALKARGYDPVTQQLTAIWDIEYGGTDTTVQLMGYDHDLAGNITRIDRVGYGVQSECLGYDHLNRLDDAFTSTDNCATLNASGGYNRDYLYDPIGNLTLKSGPGTLTYAQTGNAGPHAVTSTSAGDTFTYDANGNMTIRNLNNQPSQTLNYTPQQRLESITDTNGTVTYSYDTNGIRILANNGTETTFTLGGIYERTVDNTTQAVVSETYYYSGPGGLAAMNVNGDLQYLFQDQLEGTAATWTPSTDTKNAQWYYPYGQIRNGGTLDTDIGYTGQRNDPTGLMYYNARYYDPYTGRFTQPDTIIPNPTNPQDLNRYSYVGNNPINYNDPTGHETCGTRDGRYVCWDDYELYVRGIVFPDGSGGTPEDAYDCPYVDCRSPGRAPKPPTDPACAAVPAFCSAQPGTSGLGFDGEIAAIEYVESLGPDEFWELTSDPDEIEELGLGFLDWSNDGCSLSPDGIGGISFLGACGQHDSSYRNREAWEEATGENIFSQQTRRAADDRLENALETVCDARCGWVSEIYWVFVHAYGDGFSNPLPWDGLVPG
jgi:RHS repeat-associated protein